MKIPQLKQCCCGCTLETGSIIIGWLDLIGSLLGLISAIYMMVAGQKVEGVPHTGSASYIIVMISCIVHAVLSIMLLIGVRRRLQKYVHIWVIVTTLGTIMYFFFTLVETLGKIFNGQAAEGGAGLVGGLVGVAIYIYCILVVHSLSREMVAEQQHV